MNGRYVAALNYCVLRATSYTTSHLIRHSLLDVRVWCAATKFLAFIPLLNRCDECAPFHRASCTALAHPMLDP